MTHYPEDVRTHACPPSDAVTIDCDTCAVRGAACSDCVVTVLLGSPPAGVDLSREELDAIEALSSSGLVPPLRMVQALPETHVDSA